LPTATRDGLLSPEELVGGLAIREATAEVVSHGCRHSESRCVPRRRVPAGHGGFGYGDNPWPLAMVGHNRVDGPLVYWLQSV